MLELCIHGCKRICTAKPIRVAIDELQLHDLQNMDARNALNKQGPSLGSARKHIPAVVLKQKAKPAKHEEATVPRLPAKGRDRSKPMMVVESK